MIPARFRIRKRSWQWLLSLIANLITNAHTGFQMKPVETFQFQDLRIFQYILGPAMTNCYLLGDAASGKAVVIDPAWKGESIAAEAHEQGWTITNMWLTHAHFDHFGGAAGIDNSEKDPVRVALHRNDHSLWRLNGGANIFGIESFDPGPEPEVWLEQDMKLGLGAASFIVRCTPGHTPGHVAFHFEEAGIMFCGDLIFKEGVGRTDLSGGNWDRLIQSIEEEVLILPDSVLLLPGHGPKTNVGDERQSNPFLV